MKQCEEEMVAPKQPSPVSHNARIKLLIEVEFRTTYPLENGNRSNQESIWIPSFQDSLTQELLAASAYYELMPSLTENRSASCPQTVEKVHY